VAKSIQEQVGARIRALRKESALTQEGLANAAGLHRVFVGQLERGEHSMTLETLQKLAQALRVQPADLVAPDSDPLDELLIRLRGLLTKASPPERLRFERVAEAFFASIDEKQ